MECNASLFCCDSPKFTRFLIFHILFVIDQSIIDDVFPDNSMHICSYSMLLWFGYSLLASLQLHCLLLLQPGSRGSAFAYSSFLFVTSVAKNAHTAILEPLMLFHYSSSLCSPFQQCEHLAFLSSTCSVFGSKSLCIIIFCLFSIGCVILYTGQARFHNSSSKTLEYVVSQADFTARKLRDVSDYFAAAKQTGVDQVFLPSDVQTDIDQIEIKINSSASVLDEKTVHNSNDIKDLLDSMYV